MADHFPPIQLYIILALSGTMVGLIVSPKMGTFSLKKVSWVFRFGIPFLLIHIIAYLLWTFFVSQCLISSWTGVHLMVHAVSIILLGWIIRTVYHVLIDQGRSAILRFEPA